MRPRPGAVAQMRRWAVACAVPVRRRHEGVSSGNPRCSHTGGRRCSGSGAWPISRPGAQGWTPARAWQNGAASHLACFAIRRGPRLEWREYRENMENMGLFPRPFSRLKGASIRAISSERRALALAREWAWAWACLPASGPQRPGIMRPLEGAARTVARTPGTVGVHRTARELPLAALRGASRTAPAPINQITSVLGAARTNGIEARPDESYLWLRRWRQPRQVHDEARPRLELAPLHGIQGSW